MATGGMWLGNTMSLTTGSDVDSEMVNVNNEDSGNDDKDDEYDQDSDSQA